MSSNNRRNLQRAGLSWGGLIAIFIVLAFLGRATYDVYRKSRIAADERLGQMQQLSELETRKASLETQLKKLQTNRGVEEELRNRYQVGKPGEEAVMVVDDKGNGHLEYGSTTQKVEATTTSWWSKVFGQ